MPPAVAQEPAVPANDLIVPALLGLLLVAASPSFNSPAWAPRVAILLVLASLGVVALVRLVGDGDRAAMAAGALVVVAVVSSLLSPQPRMSFLGLYTIGNGTIFVVALACVWALGRTIGAAGLHRAAVAVAAGAVANAAVGIIQVGLKAGFFPFEPYQRNRASGLLGNPVQLGVVMVGAIAFFAVRPGRPTVVRLAAIALFAAALQVSGSRASLLLSVLVPTVALGLARRWRHLGLTLAALAVGVALASVVPSASGGGATTRLASTGGDSSLPSRIEMWKAGASAVAERPLIGHGPGRFRAATLPHRSLAAVVAEGPGRYFGDAHNLAVEYATGTGLLGLLALAAWIGLSFRRGRGPWAVLAVALLAGHASQPQMVGTTPLLFFALGASAPRIDAVRRGAAWLVTAGVAAVAAVAAGTLLVAEFALNQARLDLAVDQAKRAERLLPGWPVGPAAVAQSYSFEGRVTGDPAKTAEAVAWRRRATGRDPFDPGSWNSLGDEEYGAKRFDGAERSYLRALALDRYSIDALNGLAYVAAARHDGPGARRWIARSLAILPAQPPMRSLEQRLP
jgi:O-antigen ligase